MLSEANHPRIQKGILAILVLIVLFAGFVNSSIPVAHAQGEATTGTNFNSTFNTNHNGWRPVTGTWILASSAYYTSSGVANRWASIAHTGTYGHLDYSVRMKRTSSEAKGSANIIIRGDPTHLDAHDSWKSGYSFDYDNAGRYSVWKGVNFRWIVLKSWTSSSAIKRFGWNTLKVIAIGSSLKYYINGSLVWSGSNSALSSGAVGVQFYRSVGTTNNKLYIDWATMSTTAITSPNLSPYPK